MDSPSNSSLRSKTTRGSPFSPDASDSRALRSKSIGSTRTSSLSKHNVRASDMQQQLSKLQEELNYEKEEKFRAIEELTNMKKLLSSQKITGGIKMKIEALERELQRVKESERKTFDSLMSQTKVLEQTKISLEEVKLENRSLRESNKNLESSNKSLESSKRYGSYGSRGSRNFERHLSGNDLFPAEEEIRMLQDELRLSTEAEEKSKVAMDGLASALKEVTMEANLVKEALSTTKSKLEKLSAESEILRSSLKSMEEKYQEASEEADRFKFELEESVAAWNEKENSFIICIKISEEEITKAKAENERLFQTQKTAREENANLRDILKQAVNEASVVKESLEIARRENSHLKDLLSEKEQDLQAYRQEYECLKVSEASAIDSVKELKSLLAATSTMDSSNTFPSYEINEPSMVSDIDMDTSAMVEKSSPEHWNGYSTRIRIGRRHSIGEPGMFMGSEYGISGSGSEYGISGSPERKGRITASICNMSEIRAASSFMADDRDLLFSDDFDHMDANPLYGTGQAGQLKKKKTFVQRFGDILRRKGSYKQYPLPPVGSQ